MHVVILSPWNGKCEGVLYIHVSKTTYLHKGTLVGRWRVKLRYVRGRLLTI